MTTNQNVQFVYDLSQAQAAGTLTITPNTLPGTNDVPVIRTFSIDSGPNTSFATSHVSHTWRAPQRCAGLQAVYAGMFSRDGQHQAARMPGFLAAE